MGQFCASITPVGGSVFGERQHADDTLAKKRGNAHDIASLEIALLRAANIPARYQYGTIELDADKLQNWVGGTTKVEAAQQLLGQGGIANRGLLVGGQIGKVRMEHVWVSAYVNWLPSRGAKQGAPVQHVNPNGTLNAWVPLDPSYKQYSYTQGLDLKAAVPLDPQALINAASQGATVNVQEGWVQNLNQAAVQAQLNDYQVRLKAYIDSQNANATVGDVIGKKIIPQQLPSLLTGSLPYAVVQTGQRTSAVPTNLQHQFRIQLFNTQDAGIEDPTPVLSYQEKTSQLAGKRITIGYAPATQADADLLASYLPKSHPDGSSIQLSEFPSSLPAYLVKLKPRITLDGKVVTQSGEAITMGTDLFANAGFTKLNDPADWDVSTSESHVAGQATAIGIATQGLPEKHLKDLNNRLINASSLLRNNPVGVKNEQIAGDVLAAALWTWFASVERHSLAVQADSNVIEIPALSYGFLHSAIQPIYSWGIVRQAKLSGANIDVPHLRTISARKDGDVREWVGFNRLRGHYMSALEHVVPEQFFNDPNYCNIDPLVSNAACARGISAVRAISLSAEAGQKIFTITPETYSRNMNIVKDRLFEHSLDVQMRVQGYLSAGFEVSVHEKPISHDGWSGAGIIATDPATGAGAFLIEGGSNGGVILLAVMVLLAILFFDILAAIYISGVILTAVEFFASILAGFLVGNYFTGADAVKVAAYAFLGAIAVVGLFLAAGYVTTFAMFAGILAAAAGFVYNFIQSLFK